MQTEVKELSHPEDEIMVRSLYTDLLSCWNNMNADGISAAGFASAFEHDWPPKVCKFSIVMLHRNYLKKGC